MPAGRLRDRVVLQSETRTPDEGGGYAVEWSGDFVLWAEFKPDRGLERVEAGRLQSPQSGTLRVRYSPRTAAITERHRVLIGGEPFNIRSIADENRRKAYLTMTVEKNVAT